MKFGIVQFRYDPSAESVDFNFITFGIILVVSRMDLGFHTMCDGGHLPPSVKLTTYLHLLTTVKTLGFFVG